MSWTIPLKGTGFQTAVRALKNAGVEAYFEKPHWVNYWSFPVKDLMGYTVEVVLALEDEPVSTTWDIQ